MAAPRSLAIRPFRFSWWACLALTGLCSLSPFSSSADPQTEARYPFDPACPWGRISNGKGMLHRCITENEANKLMAEAKAQPVAVPPTPGPTSGAANSGQPPADAPASSTPAVTVKLGTLAAEKGELTPGKLGKPLDRYEACIEENGGLSGASGTVTLQFLVRAELGRAEGVEVQKFTGVTKKAARCIADVVDRRQVGAPTVPLTGATLTFEISPSK